MMSDNSTYRRNGVGAALLASSLFIVSEQVDAASFAVKEQSVTHLGNAFAGTSSTSQDASTGYYNPAGLGELKHNQMVAAATYIKAKVKLYNATAKNTVGIATTGNNPATPKSKGLIPGLHLAYKLNNKCSLGFNVVAPFGLSSRYSSGDIARYMALESKIVSVDYSPSMSYKISDKFSVGAGLDAVHFKATLEAATNFGGAEGYGINKGKGWAYGFHVGVLYKPSDITKMGLAYFSRLSPRVKGPALAVNFPATAPTSLTSSMNLPDRINYSVTHQYTDEWTAMGEVEWTHWSRLKLLRLDFNTGANSQEYFFYRNTYRLSLGADYKYSKPLTIKGGFAYEQTPVLNAYRSARLPDANRYWLALGLKYAVNKNLSVDGAYAHVFFKRATIAQKGVSSSKTLNGNYRSSADIVGVQLTWNFV